MGDAQRVELLDDGVRGEVSVAAGACGGTSGRLLLLPSLLLLAARNLQSVPHGAPHHRIVQYRPAPSQALCPLDLRSRLLGRDRQKDGRNDVGGRGGVARQERTGALSGQLLFDCAGEGLDQRFELRVLRPLPERRPRQIRHRRLHPALHHRRTRALSPHPRLRDDPAHRPRHASQALHRALGPLGVERVMSSDVHLHRHHGGGGGGERFGGEGEGVSGQSEGRGEGAEGQKGVRIGRPGPAQHH
mmetsp:Transcript_32607/g.59965  ORF Transcript_32607/g.59965 Transcript_32607/m.59965 type:complete len:245 (-) Transcript_32607:90-824(-)